MNVPFMGTNISRQSCIRKLPSGRCHLSLCHIVCYDDAGSTRQVPLSHGPAGLPAGESIAALSAPSHLPPKRPLREGVEEGVTSLLGDRVPVAHLLHGPE